MENNITQEVLKRVDTVGEKIETVIKVLADKIGVGTDHFWPIFVRQQYIGGLTTILLLLTGILITVIFFFIAYKVRDWENDDGERVLMVVFYVAGLLSLFLILIVTIGESRDAILHFTNPEYYAFKEVMNMVK